MSKLSRDTENLNLSDSEKEDSSDSAAAKNISLPPLLHSLLKNDPNSSPFLSETEEKFKCKTGRHPLYFHGFLMNFT